MTTAAKVLSRFEKDIHGYLQGFGWIPMDIGIALMYFEATHGKKCIAAMKRFIKWGRKNKKEDGWIAVGLAHDLKGCQDKLMSPRTSGY